MGEGEESPAKRGEGGREVGHGRRSSGVAAREQTDEPAGITQPPHKGRESTCRFQKKYNNGRRSGKVSQHGPSLKLPNHPEN